MTDALIHPPTDLPAGDDAPAVQIRRREDLGVTRDYGLELKLFHPWPGVDTPFRGAWCVLRPGDVSEAHEHHDREVFIVMAGRGRLVEAERAHEIGAGDLVFIRPDVEHRVLNAGATDFVYYAVWWDRSMSADFLAATAPPDVAS